MGLFQKFHGYMGEALAAAAKDNGLTLPDPLPRYTVELPRDPAMGDLATNIAMACAKASGTNPRVLAEALKLHLEARPDIAKVEIAGPGFINLRLAPQAWHDELRLILKDGPAYSRCDIGQGRKVNVEYVSVNPTGPMHAGHVRGAVTGDAVASLLAKAGYDVTREYYLNDAGTQIDVLARTTHLRYREALGERIGDIPEGMYPGEYLKDVAAALVARDGAKWQKLGEEQWLEPIRRFASAYILDMIKADLALIGVRHDVFTNERILIENGTLEKAFKILEDKGLIYTGTLPPPKGKEMEDWEPVPLTLFRSSQFGDQTDRPLRKRDGTWAYIMPDIAYHYDKIRRGFGLMINFLGADHGGYVERMKPAIAALSDGKAEIKVIYNQMVKILKNGEPVKLSKRSGNLVTLREMVEEVGAGAVRFFMLTRSPDTHLEFDFVKVTEKSRENPVFYVQYAHARCCSVLRKAKDEMSIDIDKIPLPDIHLNHLDSAEEIDLIRKLASWPRTVEAAATAEEPHRIAYYLYELAAQLHHFWTLGRDDSRYRFLHEGNPELSSAKLVLVRGVQTVLADGLGIIGVTPLEELRD